MHTCRVLLCIVSSDPDVSQTLSSVKTGQFGRRWNCCALRLTLSFYSMRQKSFSCLSSEGQCFIIILLLKVEGHHLTFPDLSRCLRCLRPRPHILLLLLLRRSEDRQEIQSLQEVTQTFCTFLGCWFEIDQKLPFSHQPAQSLKVKPAF